MYMIFVDNGEGFEYLDCDTDVYVICRALLAFRQQKPNTPIKIEYIVPKA